MPSPVHLIFQPNCSIGTQKIIASPPCFTLYLNAPPQPKMLEYTWGKGGVMGDDHADRGKGWKKDN